MPRQHEDRRGSLRGRLENIGCDHHPVARQPIRHHAAQQQKDNRGHEGGGRDVSHIARRATDRQDGERDRYERRGVSGQRYYVAGQQQPEVATLQRTSGHPHASG